MRQFFIGREAAFSRLQRHLSDPVNMPPVTFVGRRHIGKTAFLRQCQTLPGVVGVYLPLRQTALSSDAAWWRALVGHVTNAASAHQINPSNLSRPPEDGDLRPWFVEQCLPSLFRVARPDRRLLLLLDDLEELHKAVESGQLSETTFADLHALRDPQLGIAMTLDLQYEDHLETFAPLVTPASIYRLTNLTQDDVAQVFPPEAVAPVYKATGGAPIFLQRYYTALQDFTAEAVKQQTPTIYNQSEAEFQMAWRALTRDERLVLTALSSLRYRDPLGKINTARIENWMVETDYPLDATAINAAVRGLEYHELVRGTTADLHISAGLMQKWLLENALQGIEAPPRQDDSPAERPRLWVVAVVIVLFIGVILVASGLANNGDSTSTPAPTVTLVPNE